ncbi:hypothetical protein CLOSTASPAR_05840 [[Clostridium] asparagiforme DSM 15981]|uniref:Uncharacterized protein n=1 Tax=[Clostridium] asparagiforme DSM 15981 TaxID=518636 RepID=C0D990_9FIRM|nr:hypothetical protein CLOSTASPAR_05840 [[Clostridium] asparagiforme DSM 15981]
MCCPAPGVTPHPLQHALQGSAGHMKMAESPMISKKRGHSVWY